MTFTAAQAMGLSPRVRSYPCYKMSGIRCIEAKSPPVVGICATLSQEINAHKHGEAGRQLQEAVAGGCNLLFVPLLYTHTQPRPHKHPRITAAGRRIVGVGAIYIRTTVR